MICKWIECPGCKKRTPHRLVTDTTLCLICGNYATNPTPYTIDQYGVKPPGSDYGISTAQALFKHLEMDV